MSLSIMAAVGLTIETDRVISCIEWDSQRGCKVRSKSRSSRGGGAEGARIADAGDATQGERASNGTDLEESGAEEEREDVCDFVVVALPLGVLKERHSDSKVTFVPSLPGRKQRAVEKIGFGTENKARIHALLPLSSRLLHHPFTLPAFCPSMLNPWRQTPDMKFHLQVILRFPFIFWDNRPYIQCTDCRFRILNGHRFGKPHTLLFHCSPPFGKGYGGLTDQQVVEECMEVLRRMYRRSPKLLKSSQQATSAHHGGATGSWPGSAASEPGAMAGAEVSIPEPVFSHVTRWDQDPFSMGAYSFFQTGMTLQHVLDIVSQTRSRSRSCSRIGCRSFSLALCGLHRISQRWTLTR